MVRRAGWLGVGLCALLGSLGQASAEELRVSDGQKAWAIAADGSKTTIPNDRVLVGPSYVVRSAAGIGVQIGQAPARSGAAATQVMLGAPPKQLTFDESRKYAAAISADGNWVAYSAARHLINNKKRLDDDDNADVYLLSVSAGTESRLTTVGGVGAVTFASDGSIWLRRFTGSKPGLFRLTQKKNKWVESEIKLPSGYELRQRDEAWDLPLIQVVNKAERSAGLTYLNTLNGTIISLEKEARFPTVSPDGKLLAYFERHELGDRFEYQVWLRDLTGGGKQRSVWHGTRSVFPLGHHHFAFIGDALAFGVTSDPPGYDAAQVLVARESDAKVVLDGEHWRLLGPQATPAPAPQPSAEPDPGGD